VPPVVWKGDVVSSTCIRRAVTAGRLDDAAAMLGRPFSILGTVVRGRAVGRRLGYPTANLDVENEVLPPPGIYAVRARLGACGRALRPGALYIGTRPTFGRPDRCHAELHVLDLNADLYGAEVEVSIVRRLRGDRSFPSADALRRQIARDVERTRTALADGAAKQD
jgi:riboflavin kinase/FMN adenylyltransferase